MGELRVYVLCTHLHMHSQNIPHNRTPEHVAIQALLERVGIKGPALVSITKAIVSEGFTEPSDMQNMSGEDAKACGLNRGSLRRIQKLLEPPPENMQHAPRTPSSQSVRPSALRALEASPALSRTTSTSSISSTASLPRPARPMQLSRSSSNASIDSTASHPAPRGSPAVDLVEVTESSDDRAVREEAELIKRRKQLSEALLVWNHRHSVDEAACLTVEYKRGLLTYMVECLICEAKTKFDDKLKAWYHFHRHVPSKNHMILYNSETRRPYQEQERPLVRLTLALEGSDVNKFYEVVEAEDGNKAFLVHTVCQRSLTTGGSEETRIKNAVRHHNKCIVPGSRSSLQKRKRATTLSSDLQPSLMESFGASPVASSSSARPRLRPDGDGLGAALRMTQDGGAGNSTPMEDETETTPVLVTPAFKYNDIVCRAWGEGEHDNVFASTRSTDDRRDHARGVVAAGPSTAGTATAVEGPRKATKGARVRRIRSTRDATPEGTSNTGRLNKTRTPVSIRLGDPASRASPVVQQGAEAHDELAFDAYENPRSTPPAAESTKQRKPDGSNQTTTKRHALDQEGPSPTYDDPTSHESATDLTIREHHVDQTHVGKFVLYIAVASDSDGAVADKRFVVLGKIRSIVKEFGRWWYDTHDYSASHDQHYPRTIADGKWCAMKTQQENWLDLDETFVIGLFEHQAPGALKVPLKHARAARATLEDSLHPDVTEFMTREYEPRPGKPVKATAALRVRDSGEISEYDRDNDQGEISENVSENRARFYRSTDPTNTVRVTGGVTGESGEGVQRDEGARGTQHADANSAGDESGTTAGRNRATTTLFAHEHSSPTVGDSRPTGEANEVPVAMDVTVNGASATTGVCGGADQSEETGGGLLRADATSVGAETGTTSGSDRSTATPLVEMLRSPAQGESQPADATRARAESGATSGRDGTAPMPQVDMLRSKTQGASQPVDDSAGDSMPMDGATATGSTTTTSTTANTIQMGANRRLELGSPVNSGEPAFNGASASAAGVAAQPNNLRTGRVRAVLPAGQYKQMEMDRFPLSTQTTVVTSASSTQARTGILAPGANGDVSSANPDQTKTGTRAPWADDDESGASPARPSIDTRRESTREAYADSHGTTTGTHSQRVFPSTKTTAITSASSTRPAYAPSHATTAWTTSQRVHPSTKTTAVTSASRTQMSTGRTVAWSGDVSSTSHTTSARTTSTSQRVYPSTKTTTITTASSTQMSTGTRAYRRNSGFPSVAPACPSADIHGAYAGGPHSASRAMHRATTSRQPQRVMQSTMTTAITSASSTQLNTERLARANEGVGGGAATQMVRQHPANIAGTTWGIFDSAATGTTGTPPTTEGPRGRDNLALNQAARRRVQQAPRIGASTETTGVEPTAPTSRVDDIEMMAAAAVQSSLARLNTAQATPTSDGEAKQN